MLIFKPRYSSVLFPCLLAEIGTLVWLSSIPANAQITPDTTLPNNSVVTPDGNTTEINGGTTRGTNLFHSFAEFSVNAGDTAFFNNATDINNIIGRITGRNISNINGLIRAGGSADLFLINPNGIIFGENAALDIGGSFIGSTADSIQFNDGSEFSAINLNTNSLLTVSIPLGLQYGEAGEIIVEGSGNGLFINFDTATVDRSDRPTGLEVKSGKTLALVGGNVFLEGGNLSAPQGNVEVGSVTQGIVNLTPDESGWKLGYENIDAFQDIGLFNAASIEVSGNSGGRVRLKGGLVSLFDGSAILADTQGNGTGGSLAIEAADLEIDGEADNGFTSSLFANVDVGATGDGGNLLIDTGSLYVGGGAQVNVNTFGLGNAGTLTIKASEIELFSVSSDESLFSGLYAQSGSPEVYEELGRGGDINVETDILILDDSAEINVNTFSDNDGGNINIQANDIQLLGSFGFGSIVSASADLDSTGNGGNLEINTDTLSIADSSQVIVSTFGGGDGGNLIVNANEIELNGTVDEFTSGLFANSEFEATGKGGNLEINTDILFVTDGAQAIAATFGEGDGGNLIVNANEIELRGNSEDGTPSGLFTAAQTDSAGNGGDLEIRTNQLNINDSAQIAVSTSGSGDAGNLSITAQDIHLTGSSDFGVSSILANAFIDTGNAGEIAIATDILSLQDGATISASNFFSGDDDVAPGEGMAGNITIDANGIALDSNGDRASSITTSTNAQSGGNITLNSGSLLVNNSQVTAESQGVGDGGSLNIAANQFEILDRGQVSVNSTGLGQAGDIVIASDVLSLNTGNITATSMQTGGGDIDLTTNSLNLDNDSLISTSVSDSTGGGGDINIDNSGFIIVRNNSDIKADAVLGNGGNIQITSQGLFIDAASDITASSDLGVDGIVEIDDVEFHKLNVVQLPQKISTPEAVVNSSCPVPEQNTFAVTGLGGMPENPSSYLKGRTLWQDARRLTNNANADSIPKRTSSSSSLKKTSTNKSVVESQAWIVNQQGNVELVAASVPQIGHQEIRCRSGLVGWER